MLITVFREGVLFSEKSFRREGAPPTKACKPCKKRMHWPCCGRRVLAAKEAIEKKINHYFLPEKRFFVTNRTDRPIFLPIRSTMDRG